MRIRRLIVAATLTLLAALAVASPASAEPGNGAHVVNESNCYNYPTGTYCQDLHWVINDTGGAGRDAVGKSLPRGEHSQRS